MKCMYNRSQISTINHQLNTHLYCGKCKRILFFISILFFSFSANAQLKLGIWADAGTSQIDANGFTSVSAEVAYSYDKYELSLAYSTLYTEWKETIHNGFKIDFSRGFNLNNFPFVTSIFYLHKPISKQIYEWDLGIFLNKNTGNWNYGIGGHYREIRLKKEHANYADNKIIEGFNLLYLLRYNIPLNSEAWKLHASLTDFDHFLLLQETNPMVYMGGNYLGFKNLDIFSEFWYRSAGFNNIQVQYYGYFFRLGAVWKFDI